MEKLQKKHVSIKYQKTTDYKIIPATGAYGGSTPQGEVMCNFYVEYLAPPDLVKLEINPADGTSKESMKGLNNSFIRELNVGVLMRPDIAKTIGKWLIEQANTTLKRTQKLDS